MNKVMKSCYLLLAAFLLTTQLSFGQKTKNLLSTTKTSNMKTYVIEREMPGAGKLTAAQLKAASQKSCGVLKDLGPSIEWDHSYVTGNKIYCVYRAENEELVRQHAKAAGLPCNSIQEVTTVISPKTAE